MAQTINVDISTRGAPPVAYTHQGDTDRTFLVNVFENGEAFGVAGFTVKVAAILPGDSGYTVISGADMVSATKTTTGTNQLMFTPSAQYTARSGRGILTLIMTTNTGTPATLRPINIDFRIQKSADGPDVIAGASDFPEGLEEIAESVFQEYLSTYLPPVAPSSSADANKAASAKLTGQELDNLKSDLNYNHTAEPGYILRATNSGHGNEWAMVGTPTDAQAATAINAWLDDHPEATTTVQDGSLTEPKFAESLKLKTIKDYVTPEMFGAKGDGTTDDTQAVQDAINSGKPVKAFGEYLVSNTLTVRSKIFFDCQGTLKFSTTDKIGFMIDGASESVVHINFLNQVVQAFNYSDNSDDFSIGVLIKNASNCILSVNEIRRFTLGFEIMGDGGGATYNKATLKNIAGFMGVRVASRNNGYVNGNYIDYIKFTYLQYENVGTEKQYAIKFLSSAYINNANVFNNIYVEGTDYGTAKILYLQKARGNVFSFNRVEINNSQSGIADIDETYYFDSDTIANTVNILFQWNKLKYVDTTHTNTINDMAFISNSQNLENQIKNFVSLYDLQDYSHILGIQGLNINGQNGIPKNVFVTTINRTTGYKAPLKSEQSLTTFPWNYCMIATFKNISDSDSFILLKPSVNNLRIDLEAFDENGDHIVLRTVSGNIPTLTGFANIQQPSISISSSVNDVITRTPNLTSGTYYAIGIPSSVKRLFLMLEGYADFIMIPKTMIFATNDSYSYYPWLSIDENIARFS